MIGFEFDITPKKYNLDVDWVHQSILLQKYMETHADYQEKELRAKEKVKVEKALLAQKMRKEPDDYDLLKTTDKVISDAVECHGTIIGFVNDWIQAKHNAEIAESGVEAMLHKKSALENLVKLSLAGYYSEPKLKDVSKVEEERMRDRRLESDFKEASKSRRRRSKT